MTTCEENSGFLFKHPCDRPSDGPCAACGKQICEAHAHVDEDGQRHCTTCAKRLQRQERRRRYRDDPYFYGQRWYPGYGRYRPGYWGYHHYSHHHGHHHHDDLNEGDAEALGTEGDEAFENDIDGS